MIIRMSKGEALVLGKNILMAIESGVETHVKVGDDLLHITPVYAATSPYAITVFVGDSPLSDAHRDDAGKQNNDISSDTDV